MIRLLLAALAAWTLALAPAAPARAQAALPAAPDKMIEALSNQILDRIRDTSGMKTDLEQLEKLSQTASDKVPA